MTGSPALDVLTLRVQGMTCGGCARSVQRALAADPAVVEVVEVSHAAGLATVKVDPARLDPARLRGAVEDAGFEVLP